MSIEFHPEAEKEMVSAALFYEQRAKNLGITFLEEIEKVHPQNFINPYFISSSKEKHSS